MIVTDIVTLYFSCNFLQQKNKTMYVWLAAMIVIGAAYLVIRLERWQYLRYIHNREEEEQQ